MLNNDKKSTLIEMMFDYIKANKEKVHKTGIHAWRQVYMPGDNNTFLVTSTTTQQDAALTRNQEEADTKLILHTIHVLNSHREENVILHNPS